jgi:hypothetical protein
MIGRTLTALLVAAGLAAAQQESAEDKLRQQVAEISRLMRESERLLLEITRVDHLVEAQKQVEEELKKLLPPEQGGEGGAGAEERAQQRQQLESKHGEISQRLEEMLKGEREKAELTVQQLQALLDSLPRQQQQMQGSPSDSKEPKSAEEREKRLREREEEDRKQHQPQSPRQQKDDPKDKRQLDRTQEPPDDKAAARVKRVEAWIARLPPEDLERINRNDYSRVPMQYRRLVEELTTRRAKREADEDQPDRDR